LAAGAYFRKGKKMKKQRILVACEESQVVCKAFRAKGHEAYSCDIIDCSGGHPEWHIKGDVLDVLNDGWDMMVAHPECRYLCNSGVRWLHTDITRWPKMFDAAEFYTRLKNADIPKKAIENSIFHRYAISLCGRQDQIAQSWMFGGNESKGCGLHLIGLDKLIPSVTQKPKNLNHTCWKMAPSPTRSKERAKFDPFIAAAMAGQWG
jgi:hypothetical protein